MRLLASGIALSLVACAGDGGDGDGSSSCDPTWIVDVILDGASAEIADGALVLRAPRMEQRQVIEVAQPGLEADFDVSFTVSGFTPGGAGAYVRGTVQATYGIGDPLLVASLGTSPEPGVGASIVSDGPGPPGDFQATALTDATFRFVRTGGDITMTASTADATATMTTSSPDPSIAVSVQLGTDGVFVGAETTATIGAFTVARGELASDDFDCDTLR